MGHLASSLGCFGAKLASACLAPRHHSPDLHRSYWHIQEKMGRRVVCLRPAALQLNGWEQRLGKTVLFTQSLSIFSLFFSFLSHLLRHPLLASLVEKHSLPNIASSCLRCRNSWTTKVAHVSRNAVEGKGKKDFFLIQKGTSIVV